MLSIIVFWYIVYHICYHIYWTYFVSPDFSKKIIFITGGSSGIGEELCKQLIALNAEIVIIASRNLQELNRVKSEC